MRSEKLTFPNAQGDPLTARLDLPADEEPVAYALFAHCFTTRNPASVGAVSGALAREGIAVLRFDFTGPGEREDELAESGFSSSVDDLVAAAEYLEARYEAPRILVGHSLGGTAVLQAAPRVAASRAVATIGAPFEPGHFMRLLEDPIERIERTGVATVRVAGQPFTIGREFLEAVRGGRVQEAVRGLDRALLVMHAQGDQVVGIENATRLFEAARHPKSFVSLGEADHLLTDEADARYLGSVLAAWTRRYLDAPPEQARYADPADNRVVARTGEEGYCTEIVANGHALVADEPVALGGTNRGPTPYDLLAAALGACTAITLRMYADRKRWPLEEAVVRVRHSKIHAEDCARCETEEGRIDRLELEIDLSGPLDDGQKARLVEIAARCPVNRALTGEIEIVHPG